MHVASGSLDGSTVQGGQVEAPRLNSKPARLANLYLLPTCVSEKKGLGRGARGLCHPHCSWTAASLPKTGWRVSFLN